MIYIRVDANERIGTGHIMRCLSIAVEAKRMGEETTFLFADQETQKIIERYGFSGRCLDSVWHDLNQEIDKMIAIIKQEKIVFLLIDSYYVTERYLNGIRQYVTIGYIDDLHTLIYPVDLLINYNFYAFNYLYQEKYQAVGYQTSFLLGSLYVPLRKEFRNIKKKIRDVADKILITSGGTDSYNIVGRLLYELKRQHWFYKYEYYVVIGRFHPYKEELELEYRDNIHVHLLKDISNMSDYMKMCDIAITAGGVTTYELCASGIPSIMYTMADNQLEVAKTVSENGWIPWVGDVRKEIEDCIKNIIKQVEIFSEDVGKRKQISIMMQNLVDGEGAQRLAEYIINKFCI